MKGYLPKRGITETMLAAGAKASQGFLVSGCAITLMSGKTITGKLTVEADHMGITCGLGEDGCGGNAEAALITLEQGSLGNWNFGKK